MSDNDFEKNATERLRASADELDAATQSRLNQARQRALDELQPSRGRFGVAGWALPAGAAAVAATFAVMLWQGRVPAPGLVEFPAEIAWSQDATDNGSLELELLLNEDGLEMFEDLEFYVALTDAELEATG